MKCDNVLISASGAMKIADFGIAMLVENDKDGAKVKDKIRGTPVFMAPEASVGQILTKSSDVYGLALIMYFVTTIIQRAEKTRPYDCEGWKSGRQDLELGREFNLVNFPINHNYRPELKELIVQMMRSDFKKRPSAADILEEIKDWPRLRNNFKQAESNFSP